MSPPGLKAQPTRRTNDPPRSAAVTRNSVHCASLARQYALPALPDRRERCLHAGVLALRPKNMKHYTSKRHEVCQSEQLLLPTSEFMSGTNQHTWQQHQVGQFLLTIQLDSVDTGRSIERHHGIADVAKRLIALADSQRLPVTWAVSDPAHSAATSLIMRSAVEHELAILGDENWVGPTAGRTRFARELIRRLTQARSTGLEITSLVPRVASVDTHIDLVVKQHITAVAGVELASARQHSTAPRALHYG